jgi:hypothetical protein
MELFTETEAAKTLRRSKAALRRWRRERRGPNFVRVERAILYRREDLEAYIQKHTEDVNGQRSGKRRFIRFLP